MSGIQLEVRSLYRNLLREAKKKGGWTTYNVVRQKFSEKKDHSRTDVNSIEVWMAGGRRQLQMLRNAEKVTFKQFSKKS